MSKKDAFIKIIREEVFEKEDLMREAYPDSWEDAKTYYLAMLETGDTERPAFTDNGKKILTYMQESKDTYNNLFKAKDIGEQLSISSRTVSGGMRKLVTDGYVEKLGTNPVIYAITEKGEQVNFEDCSTEE